MDMLEIARLFVARAPSITHEAAKLFRTPDPRDRQLRYNFLAVEALRDPQAEWTVTERAAIAALITDESGETRKRTLRIRLTDAEFDILQQAAMGAGQTMSEYARRRMFAE